jgi:hypothetical protein
MSQISSLKAARTWVDKTAEKGTGSIHKWLYPNNGTYMKEVWLKAQLMQNLHQLRHLSVEEFIKDNTQQKQPKPGQCSDYDQFIQALTFVKAGMVNPQNFIASFEVFLNDWALAQEKYECDAQNLVSYIKTGIMNEVAASWNSVSNRQEVLQELREGYQELTAVNQLW